MVGWYFADGTKMIILNSPELSPTSCPSSAYPCRPCARLAMADPHPHPVHEAVLRNRMATVVEYIDDNPSLIHATDHN
eukprot:22968-Eustigmatos_ZCMA.PRE.1